MSWLQGFVDEVNGPIKHKADVYNYYRIQGIGGCGLAFILLGFVGSLADKVSVKIVLPCTFLFRALVFFLAYLIKDPRSVTFYLVVPLTHVSYYACTIVVLSYI